MRYSIKQSSWNKVWYYFDLLRATKLTFVEKSCILCLQVQILVGDTERYAASHRYVRMFKTPEVFFQIMLTRRGPKKGLDVITEMANVAQLTALYCEGVLNNKDILNEVQTASLIIGSGLYMCSSLVASKFSLPHVVILLETLSLPTMHAFGVPLLPSFVPQFKSTLTDEMTVIHRVKNLYHWILVYWAFHHGMVPQFNDLKKRYNVAPNRSTYEVLGTVDLIISQKPFILEYPRPLLPSTYVCVLLVYRGPSNFLRWFTGFALRISYCA